MFYQQSFQMVRLRFGLEDAPMDKDSRIENLEERIRILEEQLTENKIFKMMDDLKGSDMSSRVRKLLSEQLMLFSDLTRTLSRIMDDQDDREEDTNKKGSRNIPVE
jgi:hypothetical protein